MKHVWSLAPSVLCLSQLSGSPHALSWRGAAPSCCCVLQTLRCHVLGWSCHQHPMWPHCASTWGRGREPHPPGGFCQSQIIPVDDLGVWVLDGTAIANGTWGLFLGNPSSCQKQGAQPYLFVLSVDAAPKRGSCPMQCFAGRCPEKELLALGKLLVSAGGCSRAVSPPQWCQCLSAGTMSPPSLSGHLFTHVLLLS